MNRYALLLFWAKLGKETCPEKYHPVVCHSIDVGQVARQLWDCVLRSKVRGWVTAKLGLSDEDVTGRWLAFWAAGDDIGKMSAAFQFQPRAKSDELKERLRELGFEPPSLSEVQKPHGIITAAVLPDLLEEYGLSRSLSQRVAAAVGGHHGSFPRSDEVDGYYDGAGASQWREAREQIMDVLAHHLGIRAIPAPAADVCPEHAFFMFLAGLTSVADWIGSNQDFFELVGTLGRPFEADPKIVNEHRPGRAELRYVGSDSFQIDKYVGESEKAARRALQTLGWLGWREPERTAAIHELFPKRIKRPEDARPLQQTVADLAAQLTEPSLVLIEAPMGEGKTEAAMFLADYWAVTQHQQGCYFALPTMATSNQMFERVVEFLEGRYSDQQVNVQLLHGHAALSAEFELLKKKPDHKLFGVHWVSGDDARQSSYDGAAPAVVARRGPCPAGGATEVGLGRRRMCRSDLQHGRTGTGSPSGIQAVLSRRCRRRPATTGPVPRPLSLRGTRRSREAVTEALRPAG